MSSKEEIHELDMQALQAFIQLDEARKNLEPVVVESDVFLDHKENEVTLDELFGDKNKLVLIYNMGTRCAYCTIWADGFSDSYHRIKEKLAFVVASKENTDNQIKIHTNRNWQFPMVSAHENKFFENLGFISETHQMPGLIYLKKDENGKIFEISRRTFGPSDNFVMLWHMYDMTDTWDEDNV